MDFYCKTSVLGVDYIGSNSKTKSGRTCQFWDQQSPHSQSAYKYLPGSPSAHKNFCRNPDNELGGPWCYTTDPSVRWEYCDVPFCHYECKYSKLGKEYIGLKTTTLSGRTCQRWDRNHPHKHSNANRFSGPASCHENFCRNPDNSPNGPWCYTTDPNKRWEYCSIPYCYGGVKRL
ncbi:plasminogen-like [Saccostrea cucullata]|uniref:plasminogen-like n=1 Tax=Saccostrea cuccullata TaxID=36930 RepID=UPI002ED13396